MRISALSLLSVCGIHLMSAQAAASKQPNIVLIVADDMGWGDVGYHGATDISTPHIDILSRKGAQFSQAYVSASVSGPSRAGILTGVYQQRFGFYNNLLRWAVLPEDQPTLGEMAKEAGYTTGFIGKWHTSQESGQAPHRRGFDYFYGFWADTHDYYRSETKLPEGDVYDFSPIYRNDKIQPPLQDDGIYLTEQFTQEAVDFINRNSSEAFLLCLSYNAVHSPWQVPVEYIERMHKKGLRFHHDDRHIFAAMVLALDDGVGRVMNELTRHGLDENTLFVFISDNGSPRGQGIETGQGHANKDRGCTTMSSPGPFRGFKSDTYEGGIRIPFLISWPAEIPQGMVYQHPVISLDIFPTIMRAIGGDKKQGLSLDGTDLMPYLIGEKGENERPHNTLYWRRDEDFAIREGDWKLCYNDQGSTRKMQLFDIKNDPGEYFDLSASYPEIADRLLDKFDEWDASLPPCTNQTTWSGHVVVELEHPQPANRNFGYNTGTKRTVSEHNQLIYDKVYGRITTWRRK